MSARGVEVAELRILVSDENLAPASLVIVDSPSAQFWHEQLVQLLEGRSYDYEVILPSVGACLRGEFIKKSRLSTDKIEIGRIDTGLNTGVLELTLENELGRPIAKGAVEVRSVKLSYREDYRLMLDEISSRSLDLLLDLRSTSSSWLEAGDSNNPATDIQRFFLMRYLVLSDGFRAAVEQILRQPNETGTRVQTRIPLSQGVRSGINLATRLSQGSDRLPLAPGHRLSSVVSSLPRLIQAENKASSFDTPENRFVKIALREILLFCEKLLARLTATSAIESRYVIQECREIASILEGYLANWFFKDIPLTQRSLPLGSAVMQRKRGYREFLQFWMLLGVASKLGWDGASDLFTAGKKDVATLYEYWVFFKMHDICRSLFDIKDEPGGGLFTKNGDSVQLSLKIRSGISFFGTWQRDAGELNVRFSFNRTFSRIPNSKMDSERSHPNPGSWTRSMRPDYTISFWPKALSESQAEQEEAIVHLHFDAKYRIERIMDALGFDLDGGEMAAGQGGAKRSDLLKMHAYKDSIRRSVSAFVIFPGNENMMWREYIDILPGLGAFSLRPGSSSELLSEFLCDAARNLSVQWKDFVKC